MTKTLLNCKTNEELVTEMTEEEAAKVVSSMSGDFPQSLYRRWRSGDSLSSSQMYWFFKLAEDTKPSLPLELPLELLSDLQEFCQCTPIIQFKVEDLGKVLLKTYSTHINILCAWKYQGKIVENKFFPSSKCLDQVKALLLVFSVSPLKFMRQFGKDTGYCCVCGRELTNAISVANGIGPICERRF